MGTMSTATSSMMPTATSSIKGSSSIGSSMQMGASACKISMLWNWDTIDACFLSSTWHITSEAMFAGSCIGVVLLVISLEFFRRFSREYDRYITRSANQNQSFSAHPARTALKKDPESCNDVHKTTAYAMERATEGSMSSSERGGISSLLSSMQPNKRLRPTVVQQAIRAGLHMVQFGLAYIIMLLAMYYNGYIIISILIGAFLGAFIFSWDAASSEPSGCCG